MAMSPAGRTGGSGGSSTQFDDALLREIRDRNNIVQVVADYVSLRKAGTHFKGLCPFHSEKTPSFTVHEQRQFFYCFGCQMGGDAISFVREMHGFGFVEAVRHLADRAGVAMPERQNFPGGSFDDRSQAGSRRPGGRERKSTFFAAGQSAMTFFADSLGGAAGDRCRRYLRERAIEPEVVDRFGLGFAPDRWDALVEQLSQDGIDAHIPETLGLIAARKSGSGYYDRFRNRLMFPIRNLGGKVIGFGGRDLPGTDHEGDTPPAKYINSPDSPVYSKGEALYGLFEARRAMREVGHALVVEGNVDVLRLSQAGLQAVVAPMGTALTVEQCRLLRRLVSRVVLVYDGDKAGRAAGIKAVSSALKEGLQVAVVNLPDGSDPDSFVAEEGADSLRELVDAAIPGWEHLVASTLDDAHFRKDPMTATPRAVDHLAPILDSVPDRRLRTLYQRHLAGALGLDPGALASFVQEARSRQRPAFQPTGSGEGPPTRPSAPPPDRELRLLEVMMMVPECRPLYRALDAGSLITSVPAAHALGRLVEASEEEQDLEPGVFVTSIEDGTLRTLLSRTVVSDRPFPDAHGDVKQLVRQLRIDALHRRTKSLGHELEEAHRHGDDDAALRLIAEKRRLVMEIDSLKGDG